MLVAASATACRCSRSLACCETVIYAPPTSSEDPLSPGGEAGPAERRWISFSVGSKSSTQLRMARNFGVLINWGGDKEQSMNKIEKI